jgi:hypothetical protein
MAVSLDVGGITLAAHDRAIIAVRPGRILPTANDTLVPPILPERSDHTVLAGPHWVVRGEC